MRSNEHISEHIIRRMQADDAVDAPVDAIAYAKNLYRTRAIERSSSSVLQRVLAVLKIDLAPNRAAFGERSAGEGQARQILFDTGDNAVDLRVKATTDGFDVRGQVLGAGFVNGELEISNDHLTRSAKLDERSEFTLTRVPMGTYSLVIRGSGTEIYVEQLILE